MNINTIKPVLKVVLAYLFFGTIYIVYSDRFVQTISQNHDMLTEMQTYKGWGFIAFTALLLFILLYRQFSKLEKEQKNLEQSELKWRSLVTNSPDFIALLDKEGKFLFVNKYPAGFTSEMIIGKKSVDYFADEFKDLFKEILKKCIETKTTQKFEARAFGDNKSIRLYEEYLVPLFSNENDITLLALARDITDRKVYENKLKESEEKYRRLSETAQDIIVQYNLDGEITYINKAGLDFVGPINKSESLKNIYDYIPEEYREQINNNYEQRINGFEEPRLIEIELLDSRQNRIPVEINSTPIIVDGKISGLLSIVRDISERKQAVKDLLFAHTRLRRFVDSNIVGVIIATSSGKILEANDYYLNMIGYSRTELEEGKIDWRELTPQEWLFTDEKALVELKETGVCTPYEKEYQKRDGTRVAVYLADAMLPGDEETIAAFALNITDRKRVELELIESEERYRSLFENMSEGFAYCKMIYENGIPVDFVYLETNSIFSTLTGLKDVEGKRVSEVIPGLHSSNPDLFKIYGRVALNGEAEHFESYLPLLDDWYSVSVYCPKRGYFVAVFDVITERKKAEETLRESEERYRTITENIKDVVWILDVESENFTYISPSVYQQRGYTVEEIMAQPLDAALTSNEKHRLREFIGDRVKEFLSDTSKPTFFTDEVEQPCKDGSTIWTEIVTNYYVNEKTGRIEVRGVSRDVTDRRKIQAAIKESEERYRTITENISDVVWILDVATERFTYISPSVYNLRGYTPEEIMEKSVYEALVPEAANYLKEITDQRIADYLRNTEEGKSYLDQVEQPCKDGSTVWTEVVTSIYLNETTGNINIRGVTRNISERKKIQDALIESEERFRSTLDNMLEGCQIIDLDWRYVYINESADIHNRRLKSELLGKSYMDVWPGIENTYVFSRIKNCIENRVPFQFENEFTYPDGRVGWFDLSIQPVPEGVFILSIDITDRKKAEQDILDSREHLRALTAKLEKVREEERIHLSRELHDHLGQNLTGLKMDVAYIAKHLKPNQSLDKNSILNKTVGMVELIDDLIKNVRKISGELRPNVLDYLGLIPAIEWHIDEFKKRTEIDCIFNSNATKIDLGMEINSSVFRIIQEAFTNIIRHSKASRVQFNISDNDDYILMEIQDNGIGIKSEEISNVKSLGILGMMERTLNFNGKLNIVNAPNGGTLLSLTIPKVRPV